MELHCWLLLSFTTLHLTSSQVSWRVSVMLCRTLFLRCGRLFVHSVFLSGALVALLLQQVADENSQQPHDAEDGHQREHSVLCALLLGAVNAGGVRTSSSSPGGGALTNVTPPPAVWLCRWKTHDVIGKHLDVPKVVCQSVNTREQVDCAHVRILNVTCCLHKYYNC